MSDRECSKCGLMFPADHFPKTNNLCRSCRYKTRLALLERSSEARAAARMASRKWHKNHDHARKTQSPQHYGRYPERDRARNQFNNAVKKGTIRRPSACSACGAEGRIHGHHSDYSKPFDVEWLCTVCHGLRHRIVEIPKIDLAVVREEQ